jgi:hypothetical protein
MGNDGDPVIRYLQNDGTWGKTTRYFDDETQIQDLLKLGHKPNFTMDNPERTNRAVIRADIQEMMFDL